VGDFSPWQVIEVTLVKTVLFKQSFSRQFIDVTPMCGYVEMEEKSLRQEG
jgi:hypothetical protein